MEHTSLAGTIIVGADNSRRQLTLHFAVDTSAPDGKGALKFENGTAKIRLETDENTDRVSAFLPWDERVELRRNESGIFGGELQVPVEWQSKEASVRFVLTDKAHNRSEIWVSP
ncbi:MAG: hypothetical protein EOO63_09040 [Hymenobacter sp.]|nr:MAG: hypothetical protein EOO63_09040 [Hymenobacter sp.]